MADGDISSRGEAESLAEIVDMRDIYVAIRPLEWRPDMLRGGEYGFVGDQHYRYVTFDYGGARYGLRNYPTLDDAKRQAEIDHAAYIRNALEIAGVY